MALVRCKEHRYPKGKGANTYSAETHLPVAYPQSGLVCGRTGCQNPGTVCLTGPEEVEYARGVRIFTLTGGHAGAKFRVE